MLWIAVAWSGRSCSRYSPIEPWRAICTGTTGAPHDGLARGPPTDESLRWRALRAAFDDGVAQFLAPRRHRAAIDYGHRRREWQWQNDLGAVAIGRDRPNAGRGDVPRQDVREHERRRTPGVSARRSGDLSRSVRCI